MKKILKKIPVLGGLLISLNKFLNGKDRTEEEQKHLISKYLSGENTQIVQIGSNDGKSADPIYDLVHKNKKWKVLWVEPVPYLFNRLQENFPNEDRFSFENSAINDGSRQVFYYVHKDANKKISNLPRWYDQIGSFERSHILKHLDGRLEPYIVELEIHGITLQDLFDKYFIQSIGLLHIDTEGHDWKILSQLDLKLYKPNVILFEHKHLNEIEIKDSIKFLNKNYFIVDMERDFLCIRRNLINDSKDLLKYKIVGDR